MKLLTLIFTVLMVVANPVLAGAGHEHNPDGSHKVHTKINKKTAQEISSQVISELIKEKKIDKTWAKADFNDITQKVFNKEKEWVVTFKNKQIKDEKKRTLYVFLSLYGDYLGSNFTGE